MGLKRMLEKLGLAKTHLELKRMMSEVIGGGPKDTISYHDFLNMMLGKRNTILKLWVQIPATVKKLWVARNYNLNDTIHLECKKEKCKKCQMFNIMTCCFSSLKDPDVWKYGEGRGARKCGSTSSQNLFRPALKVTQIAEEIRPCTSTS